MGKRSSRERSTDILLKRVLRSRAYRGKHVILVHGKVYAAGSAAEITRLFDKVVKEFPGETPTLTYIPEADTLIFGKLAWGPGRAGYQSDSSTTTTSHLCSGA